MDVAVTVVYVVLVVVENRTSVMVLLLVDVYVEVVENVLVTADAVVVTCANFGVSASHLRQIGEACYRSQGRNEVSTPSSCLPSRILMRILGE